MYFSRSRVERDALTISDIVLESFHISVGLYSRAPTVHHLLCKTWSKLASQVLGLDFSHLSWCEGKLCSLYSTLPSTRNEVGPLHPFQSRGSVISGGVTWIPEVAQLSRSLFKARSYRAILGVQVISHLFSRLEYNHHSLTSADIQVPGALNSLAYLHVLVSTFTRPRGQVTDTFSHWIHFSLFT